MAIEKVATLAPDSNVFISGSLPKFPTKITLFTPCIFVLFSFSSLQTYLNVFYFPNNTQYLFHIVLLKINR